MQAASSRGVGDEGKIIDLLEGSEAAASSKAKATRAAKASGSRQGTVHMDADGEGEGFDAENGENEEGEGEGEEIDTSNLLSEVLAPRHLSPPLLTSLQDRNQEPEPLRCLGVS